jgi:hypothetical protein
MATGTGGELARRLVEKVVPALEVVADAWISELIRSGLPEGAAALLSATSEASWERWKKWIRWMKLMEWRGEGMDEAEKT